MKKFLKIGNKRKKLCPIWQFSGGEIMSETIGEMAGKLRCDARKEANPFIVDIVEEMIMDSRMRGWKNPIYWSDDLNIRPIGFITEVARRAERSVREMGLGKRPPNVLLDDKKVIETKRKWMTTGENRMFIASLRAAGVWHSAHMPENVGANLIPKRIKTPLDWYVSPELADKDNWFLDYPTAGGQEFQNMPDENQRSADWHSLECELRQIEEEMENLRAKLQKI